MRTKRRFDHLFFIVLSIFMLTSCGAEKSSGKKSVAEFSTSELSEAERELTSEERAIATRICYAYQSKGSNFRSLTYNGKKFNFRIDRKDCSDKRSSQTIRSTLRTDGADLIFKTEGTTDSDFIKNVQTNDSGFLSQLCTKIQNNQIISNTSKEDDTKVQIHFFRDQVDSYSLKYFSGTDSKILSSDIFKIRTGFNLTAEQILGMDEVIYQFESCPNDPTKYSEVIQTFTGIESN